MATPSNVAQWLVDQLREEQTLYQETAAFGIVEEFGDEFVYYNAAGNTAISKDVLKEFNRLTGDSVVWVRSERCWRFREDHDEVGRSQP